MGWGEGTPQEGAPRPSGDGFRLSAAGMTDGGRGGIFSWGFGFCLVWWGGGWRWKTPGGRCPCYTAQSGACAPITVQRGFGRPGTVGRYRPAALVCSTYHGLIRAGCPRWLLPGWLYCPLRQRRTFSTADVPRSKDIRGPGSSCRAIQA